MTETDIPKGFWPDAKGHLVPVDKIKPIDKARNKSVTTMVDQAKQLSKLLAEFKLATLTEIEGFVQQSAAEYGVKKKPGGKKGNVQLLSFDARFKVLRAIQETITFDERLQTAKSLIDECIQEWSKGSNANIKVLVNQAFQVDQQGKVNTGRVLGLRQLKIDDEKWKRAMDAIADSMQTVSSKSHVRFYERDEATGEYIAIPLDVSAV